MEKCRVGNRDGNSLACYPTITPGYTDWADVRHVSGSTGELHLALTRMWTSLWANVEDEIARARGHGAGGAFLGLPQIAVEDLAAMPAAAHTSGRANGSRAG